MNISFIGLGKLGLPLASCLAQIGNSIVAVDKNEYILDSLKMDSFHSMNLVLKNCLIAASIDF